MNRGILRPAVEGSIIGLGSITTANLLIFLSPPYVAPGIATEIFQTIAGIDGALIGFAGIISVFILREVPKEDRLITVTYLFSTLLVFVGSVLFSLFGLMHIGSDPISSGLFRVPIGLLIAGVFWLIYSVVKASNF